MDDLHMTLLMILTTLATALRCPQQEPWLLLFYRMGKTKTFFEGKEKNMIPRQETKSLIVQEHMGSRGSFNGWKVCHIWLEA